jgi:hypothetical protein
VIALQDKYLVQYTDISDYLRLSASLSSLLTSLKIFDIQQDITQTYSVLYIDKHARLLVILYKPFNWQTGLFLNSNYQFIDAGQVV